MRTERNDRIGAVGLDALTSATQRLQQGGVEDPLDADGHAALNASVKAKENVDHLLRDRQRTLARKRRDKREDKRRKVPVGKIRLPDLGDLPFGHERLKGLGDLALGQRRDEVPRPPLHQRRDIPQAVQPIGAPAPEGVCTQPNRAKLLELLRTQVAEQTLIGPIHILAQPEPLGENILEQLFLIRSGKIAIPRLQITTLAPGHPTRNERILDVQKRPAVPRRIVIVFSKRIRAIHNMPEVESPQPLAANLNAPAVKSQPIAQVPLVLLEKRHMFVQEGLERRFGIGTVLGNRVRLRLDGPASGAAQVLPREFVGGGRVPPRDNFPDDAIGLNRLDTDCVRPPRLARPVTRQLPEPVEIVRRQRTVKVEQPCRGKKLVLGQFSIDHSVRSPHKWTSCHDFCVRQTAEGFLA